MVVKEVILILNVYLDDKTLLSSVFLYKPLVNILNFEKSYRRCSELKDLMDLVLLGFRATNKSISKPGY